MSLHVYFTQVFILIQVKLCHICVVFQSLIRIRQRLLYT